MVRALGEGRFAGRVDPLDLLCDLAIARVGPVDQLLESVERRAARKDHLDLRMQECLRRVEITGFHCSEERANRLFRGHCAEYPPSTTRSAPVMKRDSSEARKTAAPAKSSGMPIRPSGYLGVSAVRTAFSEP